MIERPNLSRGNLELVFKEQSLPFDVRFATASDIDRLVSLINTAYMYENEGAEAFKNPDALRVNEASVREVMEDSSVIVISKTEAGAERILGSMQYKEIPPSEGSGSVQDTNAYFGMLAVDTNIQHQGIGTRLVGVVEKIAAFRGRQLLEIQVVDKSTHLLHWYSRLGYQEFGRRDWNAPFLTKPCQFVLMKKNIN